MTIAAAAVSLVATSLSVVGSAQAADNRKTLGGTKPVWAKNAADKGSASSSQQIDARVWLAGQDPKGLEAYATAVSTPGNALYGHFLSPAQYQARFGATAAQVSAVTTWAKKAGLTVVSANSHYVRVQGTLSHASSALNVGFRNFRVGGKTYRAPDRDASVPATLSSSVLTITGLDNRPNIRKHNDTLPAPDPNYWVAQPCSSYYGEKYATAQPKAYGRTQPYNTCGLTPQQLRGAYGVTGSGLTGKGATVAIVDAYALSTMQSDADTYAKLHGDRPFRKGQYTEVLPSSYGYVDECGASGWYGEEALDVESVHTIAPDANVVYVAGADCVTGLDDALIKIVDNRLADIVSNSWGSLSEYYDAASIAAEEAIFKQGAVEGIGFNFSSGDCGYESANSGCGAANGSSGRQVEYPSSDPWVTSVGGTSLAVGRYNNYLFESAWETSSASLSADGKSWGTAAYQYGAGGGNAQAFDQPFYQRGVVPRGFSTTLPDGTTTGTPRRVVPDVSMVGDPTTGTRYGYTQQYPDGSYAFAESRIGGTSLSSPLFAGIQALAQQAARHPLGFANPAIYARYGTGAFRDVTDTPFGAKNPVAFVRADYTDPYNKTLPLIYHLRTSGQSALDGLASVRGYDDVTGVGSPTRGYLYSYLR